MKKNRICTVVTGKTLQLFLENLAFVQASADFIELRADTIEHVSEKDIAALSAVCTGESIFTLRRKDEGGMFQESEGDRIELLNKAASLQFTYIDLELATCLENQDIHIPAEKIIISYHDFEQTPSLSYLLEIKRQMKLYPHQIMKFATVVHTFHDRQVLFSLLVNKQDNETIIVMGMGEHGRLVRILSPLLGGFTTYASTPRTQSAPGQLSADSLENIYTILEEKGEINHAR